MVQSLFLNREGSTVKNKVLDFLIVHQEFDYSLKDVAKYSEVSYPALKQLKKDLLTSKWIVLTRTVGKAQMYKLNITNKKVSKFVEFFWSVVNEEIEGPKTSSYGSGNAMSISARNL